jgi:excisionase family DNA binding protein
MGASIMDDSKWLDVPTIAKELGFSEGAVRKWIREKKLKAARFGRDYRVLREDYDKFIAERFAEIEKEEE